MKPQQRKFVVEYKSPRRQLKQERSIWGNTNFKALAKAVEIDAPQLFDTKPVSDGSELRTDPQSDTAPVFDVAIAEAAPTTTADLVAKRVEQEFQQDPISAKPVESAAISTNSQRKRAVRRQAKAPYTTVATEVLPTVYRVQPLMQEELDDLIVLEAENRRLKALLVKQLQEQNDWLRTMLERFVVAREK